MGNWGQGNFSYGWQGRNAEVSTVMPPNAPSCAELAQDWNAVMWAATSYHPGGVNAVFLDGSVRFISDTIDTGNLGSAPSIQRPLALRSMGRIGFQERRRVHIGQFLVCRTALGGRAPAFGSECWCRLLYLGWAHLAM